jgi:hypothetical protein
VNKWLEKYSNGDIVQQNYNNTSVSPPEGFVEMGYNTKGRNYSPAWGGQFQKGGTLPPIYTDDPADVRRYLRQLQYNADSSKKYNQGEQEYSDLLKLQKKHGVTKGFPITFHQPLFTEEGVGIRNFNEYWKGNLPIERVAFNISQFDNSNFQMKGIPEARRYKKPQDPKNIQSYILKTKPKPITPPKFIPTSDPRGHMEGDIWVENKPERKLEPTPKPKPERKIKHKNFNVQPIGIDENYNPQITELQHPNITLPFIAPRFPKGDYQYVYGPANSTIGRNYNGQFYSEDMPNQRGKVNQPDLDLLNNQEALKKYVQNKGLKFTMGGSIPKAQKGLTFLEPNSKKLPIGYANIPTNIPSSELASSIGGENGEPAYLIPTFKYGKPLKDPVGEFRKTGEHLGGPFKTWQEAEEWEKTIRHPYVEKGQSIPTPLKRWGKDFAMGGSIPGSVGFTYARTNSPAPSEGPYAKKTMPSAQDGGWLNKFDEGGGIIKDDMGQWAHPGEITEIDSNQITMQGVPYPVLGISDTGDTQMMYPEEEYEFDGTKVTEYPMAKNGVRQEQKGLQNLDDLLNFTNYNKPQPGGWLNKYN